MMVVGVMSDCQVKDSLTDEDYLITRARQAWKEGKIHEAKTWMLTARSIFPENFGIQLEAYVSEKEGRNVKESAKYFQKLFEKFPKEEKLLEEIQVVMEVLKKPNPDAESVEGFYLEMFEELPDETKKKLIVCAAEAAKDSFEYSKLMIVLMKKFNSEIANYGEKLIESINNAETKEFGSNPDPLNQYRTILVTEILPTVLKAEKLKINSKLVLSNLQKAQEFVLASSLKKGGRADSPWPLLYNIVHCVGRQLGWPALPAVSPDSPSIPVSQYLSILSSTQMFQVLAVVVLHTVTEYTALCQETNSVMVEAWVTHEPSLQEREKSKRRKTQEEPGASLPVLTVAGSASGQNSLVTTIFQQAVTAWSLVTQYSTLHTQFNTLISQLSLSLPTAHIFEDFQLDYQLYQGSVREALSLLRSDSSNSRPAWHNLKLSTLHWALGDVRSAAQSLISSISSLTSMTSMTTTTGLQTSRQEADPAEVSEASAGLTVPTSKPRHCRLIPLSLPSVLTYCCHLLISTLQEKALLPGAGGDLAMGHCITLLQYNWPHTRELFYHLLNRVKRQEGLTYPLFCKYVINIEVVQEIMFLAGEQGGSVPMDILPGGGARLGTRGANRGEREDFKAAMRRQAARSHEPIERVIVEFLTTETNLILQTTA